MFNSSANKIVIRTKKGGLTGGTGTGAGSGSGSGSVDPYYTNVSLLLHMNGSNGSTNFTDSSINNYSITALGNAQISTAQSPFGDSSLLLDGSGDYLRILHNDNMNLGTGDFTVEAWIRPTGGGTNRLIISKWNSGGTNSWLMYLTSSGSIITNGLTTPSAGISLNAWTHIAWTRSSGVIRHFVNGIIKGSATFTNNMSGTSNVLIGANDNGANFWQGNIDEVRLTKGVARYTSNFSTPTSPFPP